jgi:hypothetical protein
MHESYNARASCSYICSYICCCHLDVVVNFTSLSLSLSLVCVCVVSLIHLLYTL